MIDETESRPPPGAEAVFDPRAAAVAQRRRCAHCHGPFGLIRRRRSGRQFCSVACMDGYDDAQRRVVQAKARWLDVLDRAGLARQR
jgi:hypothetical protein